MRFRTIIAVFITALMMAGVFDPPSAPDPALAQDGDAGCDVLVAEAIQEIANVCSGIGRDEVCYGKEQVSATLNDAGLLFELPGDIVSVTAIEALFTRASDPETGEWGIALMDLTADLPGSEGDSVRLVLFGGAEVSPDQTTTPSDLPSCDFANANDYNINMRAGPGLEYAIVDVLDAADSTSVYAQNTEGTWLRSARGWLFSELGTLTCGADDLIVTDDPGDAYQAPMQRFTLRVNESGQCETAPAGMLIQVPDGRTANLMVNGVELRVGSTAYVTTSDDNSDLVVANYDGDVTATANQSSSPARRGQQVSVPLGDDMKPSGNPSNGQPLSGNAANLSDGLVNSLPKPVNVPPPVTTPTTTGDEGGGDSGDGGTSGDTVGTGEWGACGGCDCGYTAEQCRLDPEGACVWDPSGCGAVPPPPPATVLDCGGTSFTCDINQGYASVTCNYSPHEIDSYMLVPTYESIMAYDMQMDPTTIAIDFFCYQALPGTSDIFHLTVYDNMGNETSVTLDVTAN